MEVPDWLVALVVIILMLLLSFLFLQADFDDIITDLFKGEPTFEQLPERATTTKKRQIKYASSGSQTTKSPGVNAGVQTGPFVCRNQAHFLTISERTELQRLRLELQRMRSERDHRENQSRRIIHLEEVIKRLEAQLALARHIPEQIDSSTQTYSPPAPSYRSIGVGDDAASPPLRRRISGRQDQATQTDSPPAVAYRSIAVGEGTVSPLLGYRIPERRDCSAQTDSLPVVAYRSVAVGSDAVSSPLRHQIPGRQDASTQTYSPPAMADRSTDPRDDGDFISRADISAAESKYRAAVDDLDSLRAKQSALTYSAPAVDASTACGRCGQLESQLQTLSTGQQQLDSAKQTLESWRQEASTAKQLWDLERDSLNNTISELRTQMDGWKAKVAELQGSLTANTSSSTVQQPNPMMIFGSVTAHSTPPAFEDGDTKTTMPMPPDSDHPSLFNGDEEVAKGVDDKLKGTTGQPQQEFTFNAKLGKKPESKKGDANLEKIRAAIQRRKAKANAERQNEITAADVTKALKDEGVPVE